MVDRIISGMHLCNHFSNIYGVPIEGWEIHHFALKEFMIRDMEGQINK